MSPLFDGPEVRDYRAGEGVVAARYQRPRHQHFAEALRALGISYDAISSEWKCNPSYVGAVARGEKPWTPDVEQKVARLPIEWGVQVEMVEQAAADHGLVTGSLAALIHVLQALTAMVARERLPQRARPIKATLVDEEEEARTGMSNVLTGIGAIATVGWVIFGVVWVRNYFAGITEAMRFVDEATPTLMPVPKTSAVGVTDATSQTAQRPRFRVINGQSATQPCGCPEHTFNPRPIGEPQSKGFSRWAH